MRRSTWRSRSTAPRSGLILIAGSPKPPAFSDPEGGLIFLINGYLQLLCYSESEDATGDRLIRDQFGPHRFECSTDGSVEFHLAHGEMIRLLRANGLEVDDLAEIQAPEIATAGHIYVTPEWARRWPSEEVWKARKRS